MSPPTRRTGAAGFLPRPVLLLLGLAAAVVSVAGLRAFGGTLGPAFLALVLTVHPLQAALRRGGTPAWLGVVVLLVTVYAILLVLAAALAVSVARLVTLLPTYGQQFTDLLDRLTGWLDDLGVGQDQVRSAINQLDLSNLVGVLQRVVGGLTTFLSDLTFVVVLIFFLGIDAARFPRRLEAVAGRPGTGPAGAARPARGRRRAHWSPSWSPTPSSTWLSSRWCNRRLSAMPSACR
jgi:AI-2 transport protein TqsA